MPDIPRAYKLNKEKRAADENGKFLYYFYDRKKLTSVALPEEQFDKLVEMDREYYNLERRENDHKTTFKKSANASSYEKIDIEKDDFGQASEEYPDDDDVSGANFTYKIHKQCDIDKKFAALSPDDRTIYKMCYVDGFRQTEIAEELGKRYKDYRRKYQNIVVADEKDTRPIEEQLRDIFGDGPIPEFSNPEFRKKK